MRLLHLVRSDLRRLMKTPSVPLMWLAFPIGLSLIEYGAFGHLSSGSGLPKGTLLVADQDSTTLSGFFKSGLGREPLSNFFDIESLDDPAHTAKRLEGNDASAALVIPKGFEDSVFAGKPVDIVYTPNPRQVIRPQITEASLRTFVELANRVLHEGDAAIRQIRDLRQERLASRAPLDRGSFLRVSASFYDTGQRLGKLREMRNLKLDVQRPTPKPKSAVQSGNASNFFTYFLPGLLLFGLLMVGQGLERRFFQSRLQGLSRRIAASPVTRGQVLAAESLTVICGTLACAAVVLLVGSLLFHIKMQQPLLLFLILLGFGLYSVGLMKALFARASSERSASALASVIVLVTTLIGGGFAPVEIYSASVQPLARATPFGAASQGLVDILVHGNSAAEVAPYVLGIWAWGVALCALGFGLAWRSHERA